MYVCRGSHKAKQKSLLKREIQPGGKHVTRTHTREKPYSCPHCTSNSPGRKTCNAIFGFKTGERPYSRPNCFYRFSQLGGLKHHLTIHSGERPYSLPQAIRPGERHGPYSAPHRREFLLIPTLYQEIQPRRLQKIMYDLNTVKWTSNSS